MKEGPRLSRLINIQTSFRSTTLSFARFAVLARYVKLMRGRYANSLNDDVNDDDESFLTASPEATVHVRSTALKWGSRSCGQDR